MNNENYFETKDGHKLFYNLVVALSSINDIECYVKVGKDLSDYYILDEEEKEDFYKKYNEWLNLPKESTIFILRNGCTPLIFLVSQSYFVIDGENKTIEIRSPTLCLNIKQKIYKNNEDRDLEFEKIQEFILSGRKKLVLDWR